jgi:DNA-binding MarR family transcriptional regulator
MGEAGYDQHMKSRARAISDMFETVSLGSPDKAVGFVLWRVVHRYIREVDRVLGPVDLTHLQFTTLAMAAWLERTGELVTQSEVARFAEIHPMQVSHMLKMLQSKSLISRERSASDERAKHIAITAAGLTALRRALPLVIEVQRQLFGDEGKDGGTLLASLLRVERELSEGEPG